MNHPDVSRETSTPKAPEPPLPVAREVFGAALEDVERYADLLAGTAVVRGLIGPREVPRLWDRHLLNCGVVAPVLPDGARVCDVGSGAGLPGVVFALMRRDLSIALLDPQLRRTSFLSQVVTDLGIDNAEVVRARAEDSDRPGAYDVVVARAVAPLDRLASMALRLCRTGGTLLAMKGATASDELRTAVPVLTALGATEWSVEQYGVGVVEQPTTVVRIVAGHDATSADPAGRGADRD